MKNASLFIYDISYLVTMDHERRVLRDAWIWIEDGFIKELGANEYPQALPENVSISTKTWRELIRLVITCHFYRG